MLFKSLSAAVFGIEAYLVEVEVDVGSTKMGEFNVVGLPDIAVKESRERIKSALKNSGYDFPAPHGVTINLAPADVRKEGSAFDLPMALGILGCLGTFFGKPLDRMISLPRSRRARRESARWPFRKPTRVRRPWSRASTCFRCALCRKRWT